jgi:CheY-like chemotaxis protein
MAVERPLRVLVIDDDADVRSAIVNMLEAVGCQGVPAADSAQAIKEYLAAPFDLITLDYQMPGMDGAELHRLLSQEFGAGKPTAGFTPRRLPPIVIITGHPEEPAVIKTTVGEAVVGVVKKPVTVTDIAVVVRQLRDEADGPADADGPASPVS